MISSGHWRVLKLNVQEISIVKSLVAVVMGFVGDQWLLLTYMLCIQSISWLFEGRSFFLRCTLFLEAVPWTPLQITSWTVLFELSFFEEKTEFSPTSLIEKLKNRKELEWSWFPRSLIPWICIINLMCCKIEIVWTSSFIIPAFLQVLGMEGRLS